MGVSIYVILMSILVCLFTLIASGMMITGSIIFWKDRSRIPAVIFFIVGVMLLFVCADVMIGFYG